MRWPIAVLGAGILYLLLWPVPIDPVVWAPDPDPGLTGPHAPNEKLTPLELFEPTMVRGPEEVTRGPDGRFYTGLLDGRILRFDRSRHEVFADTGGVPWGCTSTRRAA